MASPVSFRNGLTQTLNCTGLSFRYLRFLARLSLSPPRCSEECITFAKIGTKSLMRAFPQNYEMQIHRSGYFKVIEVGRLMSTSTM